MIPDALIYIGLGAATFATGWMMGYGEGYDDASKWFCVNIERAMRGKEPIEGRVIEGGELAAVARDEE